PTLPRTGPERQEGSPGRHRATARKIWLFLLHIRTPRTKNSEDTTTLQRAKTGPKPSRNEDRLQSLRQLNDLLRTPRRRPLLLRMVLPLHVRARKRPRTWRLQHIFHPRNTLLSLSFRFLTRTSILGFFYILPSLKLGSWTQ